jgi:uncharacterized protein (UPF0333 family)
MGTILKKKKGIALLWSLVISLVMLLISGTMVSIIVKDSQSSVRIEESAQAYAAAKSGMDWGIWYLNSQQTGTTFPVTFDINGSQVQTTVDVIPGTPTIINSTGVVNNGIA